MDKIIESKLLQLVQQVNYFSQLEKERNNTSGENFNMFSICGVNHYENSHSSILAELLNPKGSHGFDTRFLDAFITILKQNKLLEDTFEFSLQHVSVKREYGIGNGRLDILVSNAVGEAILIENKIFADEQIDQLKRYSEFGNKAYKNHKLFYLTLTGEESQESQGKKVDYHCISYAEHIHQWIELCISIATRQPIVRETLIQYSNHIKNLSGKGINKQMDKKLLQLLSSEQNIASTLLIAQEINSIKNYIMEDIFVPQLIEIVESLGLEIYNVNKSNNEDFISRKLVSFFINNPNWKHYRLFLEFGDSQLRSLCIGVTPIDSPNVPLDLLNYLSNKFSKRWENIFSDPFPTYNSWGNKELEMIVNGELKPIIKHELEHILAKMSDVEA